MGATAALFRCLRRHSSTAFCILSLAQFGIAVGCFWPLPQDNLRLPWTLWGTGGCCLFLAMTSMMCASAAFLIHLSYLKHWSSIKGPVPDALKPYNKVYMDDLSLMCLIHGIMFFMCFGPLCVVTVVYGLAWADEQRSDEVRSQALLVLRCAGGALAMNIIMAFFYGVLFRGRVYTGPASKDFWPVRFDDEEDDSDSGGRRRPRKVGRASDEDDGFTSDEDYEEDY